MKKNNGWFFDPDRIIGADRLLLLDLAHIH